MENGYAVIDELDETITVKFDMRPFLVESNADVYQNCGKAAVCMGPYVMAAEAVDNCENLHSLFIDKNFTASAKYSDELCGYTLSVKAFRKLSGDTLYSGFSDKFEDYKLKLIPFAAFANRGPSNMCVWLNVR